MTDLSPDAQAVLNAVVDGAHPAFAPIAAPMAAAALRAAALQIEDSSDGRGCLDILRQIAIELENSNG